jgi:hydroxymethylpyrimidine/phosphomethylpyrimidine kinase
MRCGRIPTHHFDTESGPPDYAVDLYYDGDDFALFEAPFLEGLDGLHGRSSGLLLPLLAHMQNGTPPEEALQSAKGTVTEALHAAQDAEVAVRSHTFFDSLQHDSTPSTAGNGRP